MTTPVKKKRLDAIELQLTPKDWAISLAHEMRLRPSEMEFAQVIADKPYREWPWVKPFFKLCEQAEARYPGAMPESIRARNKLAGRLRTEFQALKKIIWKTNEIIRCKAEAIKLKIGLELSTLHTLILQDAIGRTASRTVAWVKDYKSSDAEIDEERRLIVEELGTFAKLGLPLKQRFGSQFEGCIDELIMLLMDAFVHRAVVREIEENYFNERPILFCDAEASLTETIELLEDAVSIFNGYLAARDALFKSDSDQKDSAGGTAASIPADRDRHLSIDIEAIRGRAEEFLVHRIAAGWVKEAEESAKADILQESGEHEEHIWRTFREQVKR